MKETTSTTLTKSSQVTIPARAKQVMGIGPGDRLEITFDRHSLTVRIPDMSFAAVFGSVPALPGDDPGDFEQIIQAAQDDHVAEERRKLDRA